MSLLKSIATVSGGTAISRVVGFIRDILIARFLGASMAADAFFVALRFPNLFRSLFAEGTLNVAFVPLFTGELHKGKKDALNFAKAVFSFLFYVLLIFVVVMEILMPALMFLFAPGFDEVLGKLELTTTLSRITFPFLMFVSLVSLLAGVLNSVGKFWAAAFTPTILNLCMIGALLGFTPFLSGDSAPAYALAWGVTGAGIVELLFLGWHIKKAGYLFGLMNPITALFHMTKEVKTLLKKMAPGVLGSGVYQINLFLDTLFVSLVGAGAMSWLNYAQHLFQLPIGIIGVAIGTALLPVLSHHIKAGEKEQANTQLNRGLELSIAMSGASMIGLIVLAEPIIRTLFEHGMFNATDTTNTANALVVFAIGLPAYMMTKALSPFFYARGDTTTPVKIAIVGVILNAILALTLMQFWGYIGIALATGLTTWINAGQYWFRLRHNKEFSLDHLFKYRFIRIIISCLLMAAVLIAGRWALQFIPGTDGKIWQILTLTILVGIGGTTFFFALLTTKAFSVKQIVAFMHKPGRKHA
ncbi:MAG: murein biosynthesis integral membrane protein MurJ [Alphaproteobacteria bacterium]|nr:murein biosynthesis integral membrane protein MurJ [Alphaproteobacteria bacterium]